MATTQKKTIFKYLSNFNTFTKQIYKRPRNTLEILTITNYQENGYKTKMTYHYISFRMTKIKNNVSTKYWWTARILIYQ